jgi:hypothetical protein
MKYTVCFEIFIVVVIQILVFWAVTQCSIVDIYRCFVEAASISTLKMEAVYSSKRYQLTRLHGATTQKIRI